MKLNVFVVVLVLIGRRVILYLCGIMEFINLFVINMCKGWYVVIYLV